MSWNPFIIKIPTSKSGPGIPLKPVLDAMLQAAAEQANCASCVMLGRYQLMNYEGNTDLEYPLGVFSVNQEYLGVANNASEYITLWNANANNLAVGTILSGTDTVFQVSLKYANKNLNLYALEYWQFTVGNTTNSEVHVDDNDIVQYGSSAVIGSTGSQIVSDTKRDYQTSVATPSTDNNWKVDTFTYRRIICTGTVQGSIVRVFHSRTSRYVGIDVLKPITDIRGILPLSCYSFSARGTNAVNYNNITNWSQLIELKWLAIQNFGGTPTDIININFLPIPPANVVGIRLWAFAIPSTSMDDLGWLTQANYPNLRQLSLSGNSGSTIVVNSTNWLINNMPVFTESFYFQNSLAGDMSSADADNALIAMAARIATITPVGLRLIRLQGFGARTVASAAAVTAITNAGFTITFV